MIRATVVIASLALIGMTASCGDDEPEPTTASSSSVSSSASSTSGSGAGNPMPDPLPDGCWDGAPIECNPLNNSPCEEGEACDLGQFSFKCFSGANDAAEGEACNVSSGPFCMPTLHCRGGVCRRYCCSDADCSGNTCEVIQPQNGEIGVCPAP